MQFMCITLLLVKNWRPPSPSLLTEYKFQDPPPPPLSPPSSPSLYLMTGPLMVLLYKLHMKQYMLDFFADVTLSVSTLGQLKTFLTAVGIEPATFG